MIFEFLEGFLAATGSSRPAGSIGDVKFVIRSCQTSQNLPQSVDFWIFPAENLKKYIENSGRSDKGSNDPEGAVTRAQMDPVGIG